MIRAHTGSETALVDGFYGTAVAWGGDPVVTICQPCPRLLGFPCQTDVGGARTMRLCGRWESSDHKELCDTHPMS